MDYSNYWTCLIFSLIFFPASAQLDISTHFLDDAWQSASTNATFAMDTSSMVIGLGGAYLNFYHSAGSYDDFIQREGSSINTIGSGILDHLAAQNLLESQYDIESIHFFWRGSNLQLGFGHRYRFQGQVQYPKTLAELVVLGNAPFIGKTVQINPSIDVFSYHEYALTASYQWDELRLGGRFKYLSGAGNVLSRGNGFSLFTDDDIYQLNLSSDYQVASNELLQINSIEDIQFQLTENLSTSFFSKNRGFALDVGLSYQIDPKWRIALSAVDIGHIAWKEAVNTYSSNGTIAFGGIDLADFIANDSVEVSLNLDSLRQVLDFQQINSSSYTTYLPLKIYLSLHHQLSDQWDIGLLYYAERYRASLNHAVALSARYSLSDWLRLGLVYSTRYQSYSNLGLNCTLKVGPVQLLVATDRIFSVISPTKNKFGNARVGLNFVF